VSAVSHNNNSALVHFQGVARLDDSGNSVTNEFGIDVDDESEWHLGKATEM
jgi:hypothetical protein